MNRAAVAVVLVAVYCAADGAPFVDYDADIRPFALPMGKTRKIAGRSVVGSGREARRDPRMPIGGLYRFRRDNGVPLSLVRFRRRRQEEPYLLKKRSEEADKDGWNEELISRYFIGKKK